MLAWYKRELDDKDVPEAARRLWGKYSGIKDDIVRHIFAAVRHTSSHRIHGQGSHHLADADEKIERERERAWDAYLYPRIGPFRFLDLGLRTSIQYEEVLKRLKSGERFLDMGCFFGHEIRELVSRAVFMIPLFVYLLICLNLREVKVEAGKPARPI
jgi:hypothetical protein